MLLGLSELSDSLDENVINVTVSLTVETKGFFIYILDTLTNIVWYLFFKCCINFRLLVYVVTSFIFLIFMFSLIVTTCFDSVNLMTIFKQVLNRLKVSSFTYKFVQHHYRNGLFYYKNTMTLKNDVKISLKNNLCNFFY